MDFPSSYHIIDYIPSLTFESNVSANHNEKTEPFAPPPHTHTNPYQTSAGSPNGLCMDFSNSPCPTQKKTLPHTVLRIANSILNALMLQVSDDSVKTTQWKNLLSKCHYCCKL